MDEKVRILRDYARMCRSKANCRSCELYKELGGGETSCFERILKDTAKAAETIERWAKGNSERTYLQDAITKFQKMKLNEDGIPYLCRNMLYAEGKECNFKFSGRDCVKCWNCPVEGCSNG